MSLNLYLEPVMPPKATCVGGTPFKGYIMRAYGEYDGSMREEVILSKDDLPTLSVLLRLEERKNRDAVLGEIGDGLNLVIMAIKQHGAVRLFTDE